VAAETCCLAEAKRDLKEQVVRLERVDEIRGLQETEVNGDLGLELKEHVVKLERTYETVEQA